MLNKACNHLVIIGLDGVPYRLSFPNFNDLKILKYREFMENTKTLAISSDRSKNLCYLQAAEVIYNDPYAPQIKIGDKKVRSLLLNENLLSQADCVVITTAHNDYDYKWIVENARIVVDTRNATKNLSNKEKIIKI